MLLDPLKFERNEKVGLRRENSGRKFAGNTTLRLTFRYNVSLEISHTSVEESTSEANFIFLALPLVPSKKYTKKTGIRKRLCNVARFADNRMERGITAARN